MQPLMAQALNLRCDQLSSLTFSYKDSSPKDCQGVRCRSEVVRVALEPVWVLGPDLTDGLEWVFPSDRLRSALSGSLR